jgi:hypothetical protein
MISLLFFFSLVEDIPHLDMPTHVITELSIEPQGTVTTTKKLAESSHDVSGGVCGPLHI